MVPKLKGDFTVRVSRVRQDQIEGPLLDGRRLSWEVFIGIARDIQQSGSIVNQIILGDGKSS